MDVICKPLLCPACSKLACQHCFQVRYNAYDRNGYNQRANVHTAGLLSRLKIS